MSYIPVSLQSGNPILDPNYLQVSKKLERIVQEGHDMNESNKEEFAEIARKIIQAVIEKTGSNIHGGSFNAIYELSQLYAVS